MRLSIGCRNLPVAKGDIGVDLFTPTWAKQYPERFRQCDSIALPFDDEQFDEVLASHVFEHILPQKRDVTLREWWRVLKKGGLLRIMVPNLDRYVAEYMAGRWMAERFSTMMFGTQVNDGEIHHAVYSKDSLQRTVTKILGRSCKTESMQYGHKGQFRMNDMEIRAVFRRRG